MIIGGVIFALAASVFLLWPMLRSGANAPNRADAAMAIFKDQLAEVDRDAARDLISEVEAKSARTEIKRRMLATARGDSHAMTSGGGWLLVVFAVLVPLGGLGVYALTGSPGTPSAPFAERQLEVDEANEVATLIKRLRDRLETEPNGGDARGWELLGSSYMSRGQYREASYAFSQIVERAEATSATWSQYAESLIAAENGAITPLAERAIEKARELDEGNPAAAFYGALVLEQAGSTVEARLMLLDRVAQETAPQPWMPAFLSEANRMAVAMGLEQVGMPDFPDAPRGPSQEDIQAAGEMSEEERVEFIATMVGNLEARLQDEPENLQGWLQLARAYVVMERPEDALRALQSAQPLTVDLPVDDPMRQAVEDGLQRFGD